MPEIKNTFTSGKMNKDLDERLVPNGQYTDALNVDVASSSSDNVGTIHNSHGNVRKDTMHNIGGKCIGSMVNKESQTIIWFIAGGSVDAIAEYNPTTDATTPILVSPLEGSAGAFLKFNANRLITAINVIDGYLYWTDNYSEPKRINIKRGKAGRYTTSSSIANLWTTTTKLKLKDGTFDGNILEEHLTVIRPYPITAPSLTLANSLREGQDGSTVRIPSNTSFMPGDVGDGSNDKTCNIYGRGSGSTVQYYQDLTFNLINQTLSAGDTEIEINPGVAGFSQKKWESVVTGYYLSETSLSGVVSNNRYYKITSVDHDNYIFFIDPGVVGVENNIPANSVLSIVTFQEAYNNESFFTYKDDTGVVKIKPLGVSVNGNGLKDGGLLNDGSGADIIPTPTTTANGFAPVSGKPNQITLSSSGTAGTIYHSSVLANTFIVGHIYEVDIIATGYSGSGYFGISQLGTLGVSSSGSRAANGTISYRFKAKTTGSLSIFKQGAVVANLSISIKCLSGPRDVRIQELIFEGQPDYAVGDILKLTLKNPMLDVSGEETELNFRVKLLKENTDDVSIPTGYGGTGSNGSRKVYDSEIISIDDSIALLTTSEARGPWDVKRQKPNSIFQQTFPRFAYRWKYIDGEYSATSAFSEIAFLPIDEEYEYDSESGFNTVMENDVRRVTLSGFEKTPKDAVSLDILYKESNSTSIYTVETLDYEELRSLSTYVISSEIIKGVLPSNQLLRPYDNVPVRAKAQEITGNRLLYGNYTQQYNIDQKPSVVASIEKKNIEDLKAKKSIKSIRDYQIGVSILDAYGRQTPIFSSEEGVVKLSQEDSDNSSTFSATVKSKAPSWATHYKYFVKDNSSEYYNLAMDRFYSAESDEHVWLSFPSCDVNKVSEDDFLILKKQHDSSRPVVENSTIKYKVLAKENQAPDFIKIKKESLGASSNGINFATNSNVSDGYPVLNSIFFTLRASSISGFDQIFEEIEGKIKQTKKFIKIGSRKTGITTDFYELDTVQWSVTDKKANETYWTFKLKVPFGKDISLTGSTPGSSTRGLYVEFFEEKEFTDLTEFQGRFFVKVLRDSIINDAVLNSQASDNYIVINSQQLYWIHTYAVTAVSDGADPPKFQMQLTGNPPLPTIKSGSIYGSGLGASAVVFSDKFNSSYLKSTQTFRFFTAPELKDLWGKKINGKGSVVDGYGSQYNNLNGIISNSQVRLLRGTHGTNSYWLGTNVKSTWAIDSAWSWKRPDQRLRLHNFGYNNYNSPYNEEMGEGFITGNNIATFRLFNLGQNATANFYHNYADQNFPAGYSFPPKNKDVENYQLYKQLTTVGTKFRFSKDPGVKDSDGIYSGESTIYTIIDKEIIEVNNFTTKWADLVSQFDSPTNKGVRISIKLDKKITWSPCDEDSEDSAGDSANINYLNSDESRRNASNTSFIEILQIDPSKNSFSTNDPAIFETEPKERADLDLYYETPTTDMILKDGMSISTNYLNPGTGVSALSSSAVISFPRGWSSNSFQIDQNHLSCNIPAGETITISKKDSAGNIEYFQDYVFDFAIANVANGATKVQNVWNQGVANTVAQIITTPKKSINWYNCFAFGNGVESNRIRDDFNAPTIDKGVKVSAVLEDDYMQETKTNSIIYSGLYNKSSNLNNLNQFIQAEKITKDLNPEYGTIQKLFTRNTNVVAFCENKILKILANKDALFNADGNTNLVATNKVLGQTVPFLGEFGISRNPESFANYGYRIYFTDKDRNAVIRLSGDGLTDISKTGMTTFFRDNLKQSSFIIGTYDEDKHNYNVTLNGQTVSFSENVKGWTSRKSFIPESGLSLDDGYYTFFNKFLWKHGENEVRNNFYDTQAVDGSNITFVFNQEASTVKTFKTLMYEGTKNWTANTIETDLQSGKVESFKDKEGLWFNYIKGVSTTIENLDNKEFSTQGLGIPTSVNLNGYSNNLPITATAKVANRKPYWTVNTAISSSTNVVVTQSNNIVVASSISYNVIYYIHSNETRTQSWSVTASDFTATISNTIPTTAPPTIGNAVLTNLGTVGTTSNVIKITIPISGTMPSAVCSFDVNVSGLAKLTQSINPY